MRIFTLSAIALLFSSISISAQNAFSLNSTATQSPIQAKVKAVKANKKALVKNNAPTTESLMMPKHEEEWNYEEAEWFKSGDYYYTHDTNGNVLKNTYVDEISSTETTFTYNENNNVVSQIELYSEDGEPFENSSKRTMEYDPIATNTITNSQSYSWDGTDWLLVSDGHTFKRVITRNDAGNIIGVEVYSYFMNEYHLQHRSTITYNSENVAETWKYEELGYTSTGDLVMNEVYTLIDMKWQKTDGQIMTLNELSDFFTGSSNQLAEATATYAGNVTGYITASYQDNGSYTYRYLYTTAPCAAETYTHTITDANGSYVETIVAYEDMNEDGLLTIEELVMEEDLTVTKDQYGRVIEEVATADGELMFSAKYEFTYNEEYGSYPVEQLYSEYDFDVEDFVPFLKIVATDFYDVAGVEDIIIDNSSEVKSIYNLQGVNVGTEMDNLPAGVYIINQGGKVSKIVKR